MKEASFQALEPETIKALLQSGARQTVCAWKALPAANGRAASGRAAKEWAAIPADWPHCVACALTLQHSRFPGDHTAEY